MRTQGEKSSRVFLDYANNEPKSALARDLDDSRDNKGKLAKRVFACFVENSDGTCYEAKRHSMPEILYITSIKIHRGSRQENVWIRILFFFCFHRSCKYQRKFPIFTKKQGRTCWKNPMSFQGSRPRFDKFRIGRQVYCWKTISGFRGRMIGTENPV